jgi:hypothetical protein
MEQICDLMAKLSSQHQQEVLDFAQYLAKKSKSKRKKLRLDWAGGLAEFNWNNNFAQGLQANPTLDNLVRVTYWISSSS